MMHTAGCHVHENDTEINNVIVMTRQCHMTLSYATAFSHEYKKLRKF